MNRQSGNNIAPKPFVFYLVQLLAETQLTPYDALSKIIAAERLGEKPFSVYAFVFRAEIF